MITDWQMIIHPLELCGVLVLSGSCVLYAFVLHQKMRMLARQGREQSESLESRLGQVVELAERLRTQLAEVERPTSAPGPALNLNKRGQILRMRRRGENPETIAAALGVPQNEVSLLLKVHQLSLEHLNPANG